MYRKNFNRNIATGVVNDYLRRNSVVYSNNLESQARLKSRMLGNEYFFYLLMDLHVVIAQKFKHEQTLCPLDGVIFKTFNHGFYKLRERKW